LTETVDLTAQGVVAVPQPPAQVTHTVVPAVEASLANAAHVIPQAAVTAAPSIAAAAVLAPPQSVANTVSHAVGARVWVSPDDNTLFYTPVHPQPAVPMPLAGEDDPPLVSLRQQLFLAQQENARLAAAIGTALPSTTSMPALTDDFDRMLPKQISSMKEFDGKGHMTWKEYQDSFENKAAQVLPKGKWLRQIHSKITGRALEHAKSVGLVDGGELREGVTYEGYCSAMNSALFGEVLTSEGAMARVVLVIQEGKFTSPMAFLEEKERLLSKIPASELAPNLRAAVAMMGMDPELRNQVHNQAQGILGGRLHFQNYVQLKDAVLAVVQRQGELMTSAKSKRPQQNPPTNNSSHPQKSPRYGQQSNNPGKPFYPQGAPSYKSTWVDYSHRVCVDCKESGHASKSFRGCKLNPDYSAGGRGGAGGSGYQGGRGGGAGRGAAGGAGGSRAPPPPAKA